MTNLFDNSTEKDILGLMMDFPEITESIFCKMNKGDFYIENNQIIFNAISSLYLQSINTSLKNVIVELKNENHSDLCSYASTLTGNNANTGNINFYIERVKDLRTRRDAEELLKKNLEKLSDSNIPLKNFLGDTAEKLNAFSFESQQKHIFNASDFGDFLNFINSKSDVVDSGYIDLIQGEYDVVGARSSIGKTSYALNIMARLILKGVKSCFISLEMTKESLLTRLSAIMGDEENEIINHTVNRTLSDEEKAYIKHFVEILQQQNNAFIVENVNDIQQISNIIRMLSQNQGVKVFFLDYIGLVQSEADGKMQRWDVMRKISNTLQYLSRSLKICIVALCQLNRQAEQTTDDNNSGKKKSKIPTQAELRDSGSIEQDADQIILLYGDRESDERNVDVVKNRNGKVSQKKYRFIRNCQKFILQW